MHDLIIIGAGPAGLTAAIYAGRFKLDTLIFEKMSVGGQILLSPSVENYPGFPEGVATFELIDKFKQQVMGLGLRIEEQEILEIIPGEKSYQVKTKTASFQTKAVIISSGAKSKRLGVEGEDKFIGRGVSYCGTCDGPLFKDKDIVVVGGGDRAIEDAIFLANYAKSIHLAHRRNEFRAAKILVDKLKSNPKVKFVLDSVIEEVIGENKVNAVKVRQVKTLKESVINCEGVFIFVGIIPDTCFIKNLLETDEFGFIITDQSMRASRNGIFACGDCVRKSLYQVINACGEGAVAADSAHKFLLNL
ncbi:MAG: thioredoxin-disulfide reductase [Candidatus Omnitrophota bacterium]|nr:thioredoxin-disulfide reductase [Candidatus Omnitrophota bacterium]